MIVTDRRPANSILCVTFTAAVVAASAPAGIFLAFLPNNLLGAGIGYMVLFLPWIIAAIKAPHLYRLVSGTEQRRAITVTITLFIAFLLGCLAIATTELAVRDLAARISQ